MDDRTYDEYADRAHGLLLAVWRNDHDGFVELANAIVDDTRDPEEIATRFANQLMISLAMPIKLLEAQGINPDSYSRLRIKQMVEGDDNTA